MSWFLVAALALTACGGGSGRPSDGASDELPDAAPSASPTDPPLEPSPEPIDPAETWLASAALALEAADPTFLQQTVHSWLASVWRSCETSWIAQAGIDLSTPVELDGDVDGARDEPWTGTSGPLAGQTFPDARVLPATVTPEGGQSVAVDVPYVVIGHRFVWLSDCPGVTLASPGPAPTASPTPQASPEPDTTPSPSPEPSPRPTTSSPSPSPPSPPPPSPPPPPQPISASGRLHVSVQFSESRRDEAWDSCSGHGAQRYIIRALDGSGRGLTEATISGGSYERSEYDWGVLITCDFTYSVTVPDRDVYIFTVSTRADNVERDRKSRTRNQLRSEGAPRLAHYERRGF